MERKGPRLELNDSDSQAYEDGDADPNAVIIIFFANKQAILEALSLRSAPDEVRFDMPATPQEALEKLEGWVKDIVKAACGKEHTVPLKRQPKPLLGVFNGLKCSEKESVEDELSLYTQWTSEIMKDIKKYSCGMYTTVSGSDMQINAKRIGPFQSHNNRFD